MPLISHRGAAHLDIANSAAAISEGDAYQPAYIEIDINCTSDDVLVIYHGSISRFLQGKKLKETFAELHTRFPDLLTLEHVLSIKTTAPFLFDVKVLDEESLDKIQTALKSYSRDDFIFTSPHEKALVYLKKHFPAAKIFQSQPYHHGPVTALEIARKHGFEGIALNKWWLTPLIYKMCRMHGKQIAAYTIDSAAAMWIAQKMFPGCYIITNRPHVYRRLFPTA